MKQERRAKKQEKGTRMSLGYMFESVVYVFYELMSSHCVENPPCCHGSPAFRMSLIIILPTEI